MAERLRYLSFMLRFWQVESNGAPVWRASLEDPHTSERRGFACVEALFEFLRSELGSPDTNVDPTQDPAVLEARAEDRDASQTQ